jgi:RHS repeat-associated protein
MIQITGYEKHVESGLEFAQARYYNATHGRFTSVDPLTASASIKNPQTFNRYTYAMNSPYKYTDPLGLLSESIACGRRCSNSYNGGDLLAGAASGGNYKAEAPKQQHAETAAPPPPVAQNGVTEASSIAPTVSLENKYVGVMEGEYVEYSVPDELQNDLQKTAEQAEQNQMAYYANRDQAVSALTEAWIYQDENSFDIAEDFWNMDDIAPSFVTRDGQVIPMGVPTTNGGYSVGPFGVPAGAAPSFGQGTGEALAAAANSNLAEVHRLRDVKTAENYEASKGTVHVNVTRANGTNATGYLIPGVVKSLYNKAVWKGIEAANKRYGK